MLSILVISIGFVEQTFSQQRKSLSDFTETLNSNRSNFKDLWDAFVPYAYAVAGIIALIGAVQVYGKIQNGDREAATKMGWWFGALAFLFLAIAILGSLFFE